MANAKLTVTIEARYSHFWRFFYYPILLCMTWLGIYSHRDNMQAFTIAVHKNLRYRVDGGPWRKLETPIVRVW